MRARHYYALIDVTYMGGTLPDDDREALRDALRRRMPNLSLSVTTQPINVVRVAATLRADNPLEAITALSMVLDEALLGTGLFERFDVTGRVLQVAPLERAAGIDPDQTVRAG